MNDQNQPVDLPARLARLFPGRWYRHYVAGKVRTDPLYAAAYENLRDSPLPLLDIGCGIGLLAFYLRARGVTVPMTGTDYDASKIEEARRAAAASHEDDLSFLHNDSRAGLPPHCGNVTLLDVLQYLSTDGQHSLLCAAAERVAPGGGRLVIRSGLHDRSWRHRITHACDMAAKLAAWMKALPVAYPTRQFLEETLSPFGKPTIRPLWGRTPFNNYLIVLERP
jgi:2-polyprenyl-3-methyl-5-hydroxy-6-metoxy-1,4-benzoquinol methylase